MADEVVVVSGTMDRPQHSIESNGVIHTDVGFEWPYEFSWERIGNQFQHGYEVASGDWVIHADLDFIFHEKDRANLYRVLEANPNTPALSFYKFQFLLPDRFTLKSRLVLAVNKKKFGKRIKFDHGGDLCQPSLDGQELSPESVPEAGVGFYNYEKILKTEAMVKEDVGRMARAWQAYFGRYTLGGPSDEHAYSEWLKMQVGRFNARSHESIPLDAHPRVMQRVIANLTPDQFGYNGFGYLPRNAYVKSS